MNTSEYVNAKGITISVTQIPERPDDSEMDGYHFLVTLINGDQKFSTYYTMGYGHAEFDKRTLEQAMRNNVHIKADFNRLYGMEKIKVAERFGIGVIAPKPEADNVLDCLASDAAGYENARSFEDWAADYGYDADSRKAEKIYTTIGKQATQLRKFLGADYDKVLFEIERL